MRYNVNLEKLIYPDGNRTHNLQIKSFRTMESREEYLKKHPYRGWQISCRSLKTGTYVYTGSEWRKIKADSE